MAIYWDPYQLQAQQSAAQAQQSGTNLAMTFLANLALQKIGENFKDQQAERDFKEKQVLLQQSGQLQKELKGWTKDTASGEMKPPTTTVTPLSYDGKELPGHYLLQHGLESSVIRAPDQYDVTLPNVGTIRTSGENLVNMFSHEQGSKIAANAHITAAKISADARDQGLVTTIDTPFGQVTGKPGELNSFQKLIGTEPMSQESWYSKVETELGRQFGTLTDKGYVVDPANMQTYQQAGQHLEPLRQKGLDPIRATIWARGLAENQGRVATMSGSGGKARILNSLPLGSIPIGKSKKSGKAIFLTPDYTAVDETGREVPW